MGGYGYHGDFINGWNVTALQEALDMGCEELEHCPPFHFRDTQYAQKCGLKDLKANMPYVQEKVMGHLEELIMGTGSPVNEYNDNNAINAYAVPPMNSTLPQVNYGPDKNKLDNRPPPAAYKPSSTKASTKKTGENKHHRHVHG